jgi:hypothetical protein
MMRLRVKLSPVPGPIRLASDAFLLTMRVRMGIPTKQRMKRT